MTGARGPDGGSGAARARQSGIGVPLFSLASSRGWGIGEFADLPAFGSWCAAGGQRYVQLLPLNEISPGETSPYSSMTAMALDPIYIRLPDVPEFASIGGETAMDPADRQLLAALRSSPLVRYGDVRTLKSRWLRRAYRHFVDAELVRGTARAETFRAYEARESWWLDAYVTFRAIHAAREERAWWDWEPSLAFGDPTAVREAAVDLGDERRYRAYLQWIAEGQWQAARAAAAVRVFGDLPFMISSDSPDVWTRRQEFMLDATVGVPPDAFSETGQDWGLPPWRWQAMQDTGFQWMRARARRTAALFDGVRIDHLVGLYRVYVRPLDPARPKEFSPPDERTQSILGATLLGIYQASGVEVIAEDLGTVPDFVRWSMARLGVPGFKVMRWERAWHTPEQPLIDPANYPEVSVALSGTHDTEPMAEWWRDAPAPLRASLCRVCGLPPEAAVGATAYVPAVRDAVLRALLASASRYVMLPIQDVFGWEARINTPATVGEANWTWRVPVLIDAWRDAPGWVERAAMLDAWSRASDR
ncbi:MAG: 4-alpha-glucanotransferase [Vicinamibacterales bacterium]